MESNEYRFDGWTLSAQLGELVKAGKRIRLQTQPLYVLKELLARPGQSMREELIARLWPNGVVEFDTGLNSAIRRLRGALGDDAETPRYIETIPRRGYRFESVASTRPNPDSRVAGRHRRRASGGRWAKQRNPIRCRRVAIATRAAAGPDRVSKCTAESSVSVECFPARARRRDAAIRCGALRRSRLSRSPPASRLWGIARWGPASCGAPSGPGAKGGQRVPGGPPTVVPPRMQRAAARVSRGSSMCGARLGHSTTDCACRRHGGSVHRRSGRRTTRFCSGINPGSGRIAGRWPARPPPGYRFRFRSLRVCRGPRHGRDPRWQVDRVDRSSRGWPRWRFHGDAPGRPVGMVCAGAVRDPRIHQRPILAVLAHWQATVVVVERGGGRARKRGCCPFPRTQAGRRVVFSSGYPCFSEHRSSPGCRTTATLWCRPGRKIDGRDRGRSFWPTRGRAVSVALERGTRGKRDPVVSPSGDAFVYTDLEANFDVVTLDLRTADVTPLIDSLRWSRCRHGRRPLLRRCSFTSPPPTMRPRTRLHQPPQPDRPLVTARDSSTKTTALLSPALSPTARASSICEWRDPAPSRRICGSRQ